MAVTFTWAIPQNSLYTQTIDGHPDVVTTVAYEVTATDGKNTVNQTGVVNVPFDPNTPFVPFAQLTQDEVINWVKNQLGAPKVTTIEKALTAQLERKANPPVRPVLKPAPWAAPAAPAGPSINVAPKA